MKEENQAIIKALNMYGRVPKQWELLKEIERLNKRVKECEEAYLRTRHQYSELENKYLTAEYVINELEKWLEEQIKICQAHDNEFGVNVCNTFKDKIKELKGDISNE